MSIAALLGGGDKAHSQHGSENGVRPQTVHSPYIVRMVNHHARYRKILIDFYDKNSQKVKKEKYRVFKEGNYRYINYNSERFFTEWDKAPVLETDICCLFKREFIDSLHNLEGSLIIPAIIFVNAEGKVGQYGLFRNGDSKFYMNHTIRILDSIYTHYKFKPAMINGQPVGAVYKLTFDYFKFYKCSGAWPFSPTPKSVDIPLDACGNR